MTRHDDFLKKELLKYVKSLGFDDAISLSSANATLDHQVRNPRLAVDELKKYAASYARHNSRAKGAPAFKRTVKKAPLPRPKWFKD